MSKIGRKPISVQDVNVTIDGQVVTYKGQKSEGTYLLPDCLRAKVENDIFVLQALYRAYTFVTSGFTLELSYQEFMKNGNYDPKPSIATISNAMDVGNPSNFIRIQEMYDNDLALFKKDFTSFSYSDTETLEVMQSIYSSTGYIAEPHGAVGYLGLKKELENHPNAIGIFLETAHPIKFSQIVEASIGHALNIPDQVKPLFSKEKKSVQLPASFAAVKDWLMPG